MRSSSREVLEKTADNPFMLIFLIQSTHLRTRPVCVSLCLCLCLLALSGMGLGITAAQAAIYSCPNNDGSVLFQDRPCQHKPAEQKPSKPGTHHLPLGIHESWFSLPSQADHRAFCDRRQCECSDKVLRHQRSLMQAVADALYIDGSWHRYDTRFMLWKKLSATSPERKAQYAELQEAACSIMMSQQLLMNYADEVTQSLRQQTVTAKQRGFDTSEPCNAGVEGACAAYESTLLLQQIQRDAQALYISRDAISSDPLLPMDE